MCPKKEKQEMTMDRTQNSKILLVTVVKGPVHALVVLLSTMNSIMHSNVELALHIHIIGDVSVM